MPSSLPSFTFRATKSEKEAWKAEAKKQGISLNAWMRNQCNQALETIPAETVQKQGANLRGADNAHGARYQCLWCKEEFEVVGVVWECPHCGEEEFKQI